MHLISVTSYGHNAVIRTPEELIFAHPVVQCVSGNPQKTCCPRPVPVVSFQRTLEHLFLDSKEADSGRREIDLERIVVLELGSESGRKISEHRVRSGRLLPASGHANPLALQKATVFSLFVSGTLLAYAYRAAEVARHKRREPE